MATIDSSLTTELPHLPPAPDGRVRFSRAAYYRMAETGVLDPDKRYELLDGEIIMSPPIGPGQGGLISRLAKFFITRLPDSIDCRIQLPVILSNHSEPEPDLALIRRRDDDYRTEHPEPADVLLLVEVSQSSLSRDRGQKMKLYAQAGVSEYWIVDVKRELVLVHREPSSSGYSSITEFAKDAAIAPLCATNCPLDLAWLFR